MSDTNVYAAQMLFDSLLDFEDISEDTTQIVYAGNISHYVLTSTSVSLSTSFRSVSTPGSVSLVTRTMNITKDQYTDVVYFFDTPTDSGYFSLIENWNQTLSINIT